MPGPLVYIGIQLGVAVGLWALNKWVLAEDAIRPPAPRPEDLDFAQTKIGSPIPLTYGTIRVEDGVLIWHGLHAQDEIASSSSGFSYRAAMLVAVGTPSWDDSVAPYNNWRSFFPPMLLDFWYGDKKVGGTGTMNVIHGETVDPVAIRLGGLDDDLLGRIQFFDGRPTQLLTDGVGLAQSAMLASGATANVIPGYRHQMLALLDCASDSGGYHLGYNANVHSMGFEIRSLGPDRILEEANPAWVIYDLMTGPVWKLGFSTDQVDLASFTAAAATLVSEANGVSLVIYRGQDATQIIGMILAQIDGVMFEDPATGTIKLKLIRQDYDVATIPHMTVDNTIGQPKLAIIGWRESSNRVRLSYTDRSREYKTESVEAQRLANAVGQDGRVRTHEISYPFCMTSELAERLAARDLAVVSRPIITAEVVLDRSFYTLLPGDAIKATWAQYGLSGKVFRVVQIDMGQHVDDSIRATLIEDVFGKTVGAFPGPEESELDELDLIPLTERYYDEAPYLLIYQKYSEGGLPNLTDQRVIAAAVAEPEAVRFEQQTQSGGVLGFPVYTAGNPMTSDVNTLLIPLNAEVETSYSRLLEPFDNTTGLRITNVGGLGGVTSIEGETYMNTLAAAGDESTNEIEQGANLMLAIDANGDEEYLAFTSVTDLGGTPKIYRLNGVWRGLLDTVPLDLVVGSRLYQVSTSMVGVRGWGNNVWTKGNALPVNGSLPQPGDYCDDQLRIALRKDRSLRLTDFRCTAYEAAGTRGVPAVLATYPQLGHFKTLSQLDGAIDLDGRQQTIASGIVVRGDSTIWVVEGGTTFDVYIEKDGDYGAAEIAVTGKTGLSAMPTTGVLLGQAGHGEIDVRVHTVNATKRSWHSPRIRVTAPHYRDLLANGSFDYNAITPGWVAVTGTVAVQTGAGSLSRETTGRWIETASGSTASVKQTVDVTGYKPTGLDALVTWYTKNFDAENDNSVVVIRSRDAADVELNSVTSSAVIGPTTHWRRSTVSLDDLAATTAKIEVEVQLNLQAEGDLLADVGVTRVQLQLGQFSAQLLANPSFDGNTTGWTNVLNSFVVNSANPYASDNGTVGSGQGGAFSSSEIAQQVSFLPAFNYGKVVLTFARSTTIAGDTGEVIVEVKNGAGTVIATATTGAEAPTGNFGAIDVWLRRRLVIDLPDDAASLNVRLLANRAAGSGNSGACFDDFSLRIFKDLDPVTTKTFDFGTPSRTKAPTTWPAFHIALPDHPIPAATWGGISVTPSTRLSTVIEDVTHKWSDDPVVHTTGKFYGYWTVDESNVETTDAYRFVRALAASAVDLQSIGGTGDQWGKFGKDTAFTVAVLLRSDEVGTWGGACGILGRRDAAGVGWGLGVDASGFPQAVMQGALGAFTATAPDVVNDGAPRWVIVRNDPSTNSFSVHTRSGSGGITADDAGNIDVSDAPFRIGRDGPASASFPGQIARVHVWRVALTNAEVAVFTEAVGKDPTTLLGTVTSWSSSQPVWSPGPTSATTGATLMRFGTSQIPIAYDAVADADGDGYGLVLTQANTNRIPSFNFADSTKWAPEDPDAAAHGVLTQGVVDPTGLPRGVKVDTVVADKGIRVTDIPMTSASTWRLIFYAKSSEAVPPSVKIELLDSNGASKGSSQVNLTSLWQRFVVAPGSWDNATPTAILRFYVADSVTGKDFDLGHVMWLGPTDVDYPIAIQDAGLAIADTYARRLETLDRRFSHEGEIFVEGVMPQSSPTRGPTIASIDNDTNTNDKRQVTIETGPTGVNLNLHNATGTPSSIEASIDWATSWEVRARWNTLYLPEPVSGTDTHGIRADDGSVASTYSNSTFTVSTTALAALRIGGGDPSGSTSPNAVIRKVSFRTREEKLA